MGGFSNFLTVVLEVGFSVDRDTTTTTITIIILVETVTIATIILVGMGSMVIVLPTIINGLIIAKLIVSYVMV